MSATPTVGIESLGTMASAALVAGLAALAAGMASQSQTERCRQAGGLRTVRRRDLRCSSEAAMREFIEAREGMEHLSLLCTDAADGAPAHELSRLSLTLPAGAAEATGRGTATVRWM